MVNNYPPAADEIARVVGKFAEYTRFDWQIIFREKTLIPVESWYSAISENALPDEVVFLHGDDDIFCPDALVDRYNAIVASNADMLLSRALSRIIFDFDKACVLLDMSEYPVSGVGRNRPTANLTIADVIKWGPAFIGSHTYRNTKKFQQALDKCFEWCNSQSFLDWNTRTLMLPFYLPTSVLHVEGQVSGLDEVCVLRGGDKNELNASRFGVPGWNSGFLTLAALDVFKNTELLGYKELDSTRRKLRRMAIQWFATYYFDNSIPKEKLNTLIRKTELGLGVSDFFDLANGVRLVVGEISGLRAYRLNSRMKNCNVMPIKLFLEVLSSRHHGCVRA